MTAQFKNVHHDGVVFDHDPLSETYTLLFPDGDVRVFRSFSLFLLLLINCFPESLILTNR